MRSILRFIIEVGLIAGVIYLGWDKPYEQWVEQIAGRSFAAKPQPSVVQRPVVSASPSGAWMRDPNHLSALDTPRPHGETNAAGQKPGSWMFDPNHHSALDSAHPAVSPH